MISELKEITNDIIIFYSKIIIIKHNYKGSIYNKSLNNLP